MPIVVIYTDIHTGDKFLTSPLVHQQVDCVHSGDKLNHLDFVDGTVLSIGLTVKLRNVL